MSNCSGWIPGSIRTRGSLSSDGGSTWVAIWGDTPGVRLSKSIVQFAGNITSFWLKKEAL